MEFPVKVLEQGFALQVVVVFCKEEAVARGNGMCGVFVHGYFWGELAGGVLFMDVDVEGAAALGEGVAAEAAISSLKADESFVCGECLLQDVGIDLQTVVGVADDVFFI